MLVPLLIAVWINSTIANSCQEWCYTGTPQAWECSHPNCNGCDRSYSFTDIADNWCDWCNEAGKFPEACESCDDGIQNQDETGIDCGGSCDCCVSEYCTKPWNTYELLEPPAGTAWRGSCLGTHYGDGDRIANWTETWGVPLHIYRGFYGSNWWFDLEDWQLDFVNKGGILFYSIADSDWITFADPDASDTLIQRFISVFQTIAPAKAWISFRYEPELYVDYDTGMTPAVYRAAWQNIHQKFEEAGVENAVWAIDYSTKWTTDRSMHPLLAAMWPGDEYVDWLLWNSFLFDAVDLSFTEYTRAAYELFEELSGEPQLYEGEYYTANYNSKLWGFGAWGASTSNWKFFTEAERATWLEGAAEFFNSDEFPRIRAEVYFDTADDNINSKSSVDTAETKVPYQALVTGNRFAPDVPCTYVLTGERDCAGNCDGPAVEDDCGVCDGDGSSCSPYPLLRGQ